MVRVEVYLQEFKLYLVKSDGFPDENSLKRVFLSKRSRLAGLAEIASTVYKVRSDIRLWDWEDERDTTAKGAILLSDMDPTIEQSGLIHGQNILVERPKGTGIWPRDSNAFNLAKNDSDSGNGTSKSSSQGNNNGGFLNSFISFFKRPKTKKKATTTPNGTASPGSGANANGTATEHGFEDDAFSALIARAEVSGFTPGLCGLRNLGNTCFMNSALQCLSNTVLLRNYFLEGKFKDEINEKNPLGMQGNIAKQYGALVRAIWSGDNSYFVPKNFKHTLGRWAPQFEGFNQHDTHELLAFLLDGLHEDLNRISGKKPYVEVTEGHGRPDAEVALEAWTGHLRRNSSVIVDLFHGQLKSTVTCPDCNHISVTFDPFMYLSLPLQQESSRNIEISLWRMHSFERASKYSVKVPRGGKVSDVSKELSRLSGVPAQNMIIIEMHDSRPVAFLQQKQDTASFAFQRTYMAYEFPDGSLPSDQRETVAAVMIHRRRSARAYASSYGHPWSFHLIGLPYILQIKRGITTGRELYETVWNKSARFLKADNTDSDDTDEDDSEDDSSSSKDGEATKNDPKADTKSAKSDDKSSKSDKKKNGSKDTKSSAPSANGSDSSTSSTAKSSVNSSTDTLSTATANSNGTPTPEEKKAKVAPRPYLNAYSVDTYPFKLAFTNPLGTSCSICGNICDGCVILPTDDPIFLAPSVRTPTIAIEWSSLIIDHYYIRAEACAVTIHPSLADARLETKNSEANLALRDCLSMYTTTERLSELDPWYCPTCKEHRCAWKKLDLWKLPEVLVVHLKRFHFSAAHRNKIGWLVDFPLRELSLDEFVINPEAKGAKYELFSVANHMGGLSSGHYIAIAKCDITGKWYTFDDSNVSPTREKSVVTPSAYVLFYRRMRDGPAVETTDDASTDTNETVEVNTDEKKQNKSSQSEEKKDGEAKEEKKASEDDKADPDAPVPNGRHDSPAKKDPKPKKSSSGTDSPKSKSDGALKRRTKHASKSSSDPNTPASNSGTSTPTIASNYTKTPPPKDTSGESPGASDQ